MKPLLISMLLSMLVVNAYSQNLSATETQIVQYINEHYADGEKLLIETVNINSGTLNKTGVKQVGDIFTKELEKAGLHTEWVSLPDSLKRAGHLVASRYGKNGKKIFIIGHLDTVFEPDMPANPWHLLNDSTATGQGANDMKGGDMVAIIALQALESLHLLDSATIFVYFTGDEERAGTPVSVSRKDFIERAKQCDVALGFESAIGLHTVAAARRGSSSWTLKVSGKTGHSAGIFSDGSGFGAIYEAARIINEFRVSLSHEKYLTFNPGLIAGGSDITVDERKATVTAIGKSNIIAQSAYVSGDLRFLTETQKETARRKMQDIVSSHLNQTNATIHFQDGIPAMEPTPGNYRLVNLLDSITHDLGFGNTKAGDPGARGAGDISYIAKYVDALDGLGASGSGAHAPGETINLKEFPLLIQRAAILIYRLTRETKS